MTPRSRPAGSWPGLESGQACAPQACPRVAAGPLWPADSEILRGLGPFLSGPPGCPWPHSGSAPHCVTSVPSLGFVPVFLSTATWQYKVPKRTWGQSTQPALPLPSIRPAPYICLFLPIGLTISSS